MGILSGLFRSRDKPTDRTAGSSYSFFLGGTSSGKYVPAMIPDELPDDIRAIYDSSHKK